jgi:alginate O-acetyltransferase complex protein AlgJ
VAERSSDSAPGTPAYRYALVVTFVIGIFLPLIDWRWSLDHSPELTENRVLAPAPAWPKNRTEWALLPKALERYWNDAFGFRRTLIRWQAEANYDLGVSSASNVVIGKQPWLFFAGEQSMEQRRGLRPFSEAELENWAQHLEARRAWLASRGAHYLFVVAPDKHTIYPEAVPDRYGPLGRTPLDQLTDYLRAHSRVDVLDLRPTLKVARGAGEVYLHTDTHWNDRGAFAAYSAIVERLRVWYPQLRPRSALSFERHWTEPWNGDLAVMIGGVFDVMTERSEQWQPTSPLAIRELATSDYRPPDAIQFAEFDASGSEMLPRAVIFHDSFLLASDERPVPGRKLPARALPPPPPTFRIRGLLAEQFSHAAFSWQYPFDSQLVEREHPDLVIEEHAERLIRRKPQGSL